MPTQIDDNEFLLKCACGDRIQHVAWLIHDPNDPRGNNLKGYDDDWYLITALDRNISFWRRILTAIKYIFRPKNLRFYGYSELVLRNEDVDRLAEFITQRRTSRI